MPFHLKFVFLILLIFNHYHDAQGLPLQNKWAPLASASRDFLYQRNVRPLAQETNLTEPETTEASLTTTTIVAEFEDSETTGTTPNATSAPETLQAEFLRKPGGGFEGFIEKIHNHQLNKLELLKNKFTTTISPPITTTPSVPIVTPTQPVTLPSYTIIKIVKFPCGPFLKCLLKKGKIATTTTTVPPTTPTTTPRTTTTTTPRTTTTTTVPITIGTPRNPVVTMRNTST